MSEPSQYEKDTREMFGLLRNDINTKLDKLETLVTNHLFHRVQPWVVIVISGLVGLLGIATALIL